MKKHLLMIIVLFLITGCSKDIKTEVYSNIEQNNDEFISINYPETNIRKLNNFIKKDINKTKEAFNKIDNKEKELNIDYTYNVVNNNYININIEGNNTTSKDIKVLNGIILLYNQNKLVGATTFGIENISNKKDFSYVVSYPHVTYDKVEVSYTFAY